MANFESGITDFLHIPITVDITFPITNKGEILKFCDFCKLFTGRKCVLTEEVIYNPSRYVGFNCPLNKIEEKEE